MKNITEYRQSVMERLNERFPYEMLSQQDVLEYLNRSDPRAMKKRFPQFSGVRWPVPKDFVADVVAEDNAKLSKGFLARRRLGVYPG